MKILMIGHSLGMDNIYLFPEVMNAESPDTKFVIGTLYHSGCRLSQHVQYSNMNAKEYAYLEFDSQKDTTWRIARANGTFTAHVPNQAHDTLIFDGTIGVTMQFGIQQHDWDIVITQAGVFEAANVTESYGPLVPANIKKIKDY